MRSACCLIPVMLVMLVCECSVSVCVVGISAACVLLCKTMQPPDYLGFLVRC